MPAHLLIGAGAGLVSAVLFVSAVASTALAGIIFYLCPLPLCLAGVGWGRQSVAIAGLVGTIAAALFLGAMSALAFAVIVALPTAALIHLLLLSRTVTVPDAEAKSVIEWYPPGRLVAAAALMAGGLASLMVLSLGPDMESYQATIDEMMPPILDALGAGGEPVPEAVAESLRSILTKALPAAFAIVWLTIALFNLWLAGTIARSSGHALRPWPDLHRIEIPGAMVVVFAVALGVSFLPGMLGLIGTGFAGATLLAYMLQGLAVIHVYTLGLPARPVILAVVYLGILFLGWVAILIAILGLGEPMLGLRARTKTVDAGKDKSNSND